MFINYFPAILSSSLYLCLQVQFGHAGASANASGETAAAKNAALSAAGARVPRSFDDLGREIRQVFSELVKLGKVEIKEETPPPAVPMDYAWARVSRKMSKIE